MHTHMHLKTYTTGHISFTLHIRSSAIYMYKQTHTHKPIRSYTCVHILFTNESINYIDYNTEMNQDDLWVSLLDSRLLILDPCLGVCLFGGRLSLQLLFDTGCHDHPNC